MKIFENKRKIIKNFDLILASIPHFDQCKLINRLLWIHDVNYLAKRNFNYV
jgi:hypothetical protein